jgi:hypothetical protein
MNNKILTASKPSPLVRVWRSTGHPRMPLAAIWVQADNAELRPNPVAPSSEEMGGLRLCA